MEDKIDLYTIAQLSQKLSNEIGNEVCNKSSKEIQYEETGSSLNEQSKNLIKDAFEEKLNGGSDTFIKTILGAATLIAQEKGELKNLPNDADAISSIIDDSYEHSKLAWLVSKGLIAAENAIDQLIERAHIRVFAYFERILESESIREYIVDGVINLSYFIPKIGVIVGPLLESERDYILLLISVFEDKIRCHVKKALSRITDMAKKVVTKIREGAEKILLPIEEKEYVNSK